ncbi:hypothetical protein [Candidatus Poriferisocius sp.]|uniref:hypothetical protein n=1 Tax=Candidatus Poriferisocius sp. TaxID=3101276 RepID=UPI003B5C11E2
MMQDRFTSRAIYNRKNGVIALLAVMTLILSACGGAAGSQANGGLATLATATATENTSPTPVATDTSPATATPGDDASSSPDTTTVTPASAEQDNPIDSGENEEAAAAVDAEAGDSAETDDPEEALLNFSQCMRDNGIPEFPDPTYDSSGNLNMRQAVAAAGIQPRSEEFREAMATCNQLLAGVALRPGGDELDQVELQDQLLEFAQCLRDQGIEVDDPDFSNFGPPSGDEEDSGPGRGPFGDAFDLQDADVQAAVEECREITGGFGARLGGPGPRPNADRAGG